MAEKAAESKRFSLMPDWSLIPQELLQIISENIEECFDLVNARSVCSSWRSTPSPAYLLRTSYSLPILSESSLEDEGCTLEKIPLFLFRRHNPPLASASEYFLGGIGRDESEDQMELPSPLQCSVKVNIPGSDPTLMNMNDCQILPLGHQYRIFGWEPKDYNCVAFLLLNKEGGGEEFIVLLNYSNVMLMLTSAEMKWKRLENIPQTSCSDLVTFRGKFYAYFLIKQIFVIDPHSLEASLVLPLPEMSLNYLVASGDEELFLVDVIIPAFGELDFSRSTCKVSRLDEEASKWVEVSDLGDRILFIGHLGNVCCSAKELPDGCGISGN